ncbi:MAG: hypothetical protein A2Z49_00530 [Chloroflexi bacterium RBG_19FT_COMBO_56_12]|nr:MAG: hypothetical protein A2Z49_00530 [Chloroflexi bacterium RBG_19FT_COMBO_56_12]
MFEDMGKRDRNQLLDDHQEWVDHMYNPGYWINRVGYAQKGGWRWARKYHRLVGAFGALAFSGMIATILINQSQAGLSLNPASWRVIFDANLPGSITTLGFLLLFLLLFIASLTLFFSETRPERGKEDKK